MIRNITGVASTENEYGGYFNVFSGALKGYTSWSTRPVGLGQGTYAFYQGIKFEASGSVTTSSENRPINISAIPLIVAL